jgi:hypothetical protein
MTTVVDGIRVLTFDEWKIKPEVLELENDLEDCDVCNGDGTHECECGDEHDCCACDGAGKISNLKDIYAASLREELARFLEWREGLPKKVLSKKGRKP